MPVPTGSVARGHDDHLLPEHFASTAPAPAPKRRPRPALLVGTLVAIAVVCTLASLQLGAHLGYDDELAAFDASLGTAETAVADAQQREDMLRTTSDFATRITADDSGVLGDPALKDALSSAIAEASETSSSVEELIDDELPSSGVKPTYFWELFPAAERLAQDREELDDFAGEIDSALPSVSSVHTSLNDAGVAFVGSAASSASAFEASHVSSGNDAVIALREAASTASVVSTIDQSAVDAWTTLQHAASQVLVSEQSELAEKAGPLLGTRLEIETFARSLAPGVLIEFDWNPIVSNAGANGSMGGLTTWWWDEPDRAVIELSHSVAEQWPDVRSKALVVHEVGHAISVKCEDMYDSSTQDSIENWATAWAISMGYTDEANGVWAYGYPPQSYIDAAYGCR